MRWGSLLEDAILKETQTRLGVTIFGQQTRCEHRDRKWARATVDAFYREDPESVNEASGVVEVKTTSDFHWNEVPRYYEAQVVWQLEVTQCPNAWVAVLHNGRRLSLWPIDAQPELAAAMLDIAERFWTDYVLRGVPPEIDGLAGTSQALSERYATEDPDSFVELDDATAATVERLRGIRGEIRELETKRDALENEIKAAMGDAEIATYSGAKLATWRTQERHSIDLAKLRDEYPREAAACEEITSTRVFRLPRQVRAS
jgi:predicted phage-related endonuclease